MKLNTHHYFSHFATVIFVLGSLGHVCGIAGSTVVLLCCAVVLIRDKPAVRHLSCSRIAGFLVIGLADP